VIKLILYATKLRALAIIGVLLIHISARLVRQEVGSFEWWIGNIVDSSARWAVPIFIMLSGMLLLGRKEPQTAVIKKRVSKVFWPLLFWSFIYSLWSVRYDLDTYSIYQAGIDLFQGSIKYHLWYLYVILGLYLCMPLFKTFIQHGKKTEIRYFIFLSFFISAISITLSSLFKIRIAGGFEYLIGYGGYFLLGYYLANNDLSKGALKVLHSLGAAGLLLTTGGTWLFSMEKGTLNQVFYEYLSFTTPFVAISVFLLVKEKANKDTSRLTEITAKYSFGIYLIHPIILDLLRGREFIQLTGLSHLTVHPIPYIVFMLSATFSASLLLSVILHKTPFLKRFV
jgi:surface polysaccharide O-acyltransferase-like enzyme